MRTGRPRARLHPLRGRALRPLLPRRGRDCDSAVIEEVRAGNGAHERPLPMGLLAGPRQVHPEGLPRRHLLPPQVPAADGCGAPGRGVQVRGPAPEEARHGAAHAQAGALRGHAGAQGGLRHGHGRAAVPARLPHLRPRRLRLVQALPQHRPRHPRAGGGILQEPVPPAREGGHHLHLSSPVPHCEAGGPDRGHQHHLQPHRAPVRGRERVEGAGQRVPRLRGGALPQGLWLAGDGGLAPRRQLPTERKADG
mmetsp:Transcript_17908/g.69395  ORF Transcript_17908/g.69395 Transcript_17908/m.69395 type:complete len:252 (+) Transcript_17908:1062-1817(+)